MDIKYIDLVTMEDGAYNIYRIDKENIIEFNLQSKKEIIDCSSYTDNDMEVNIVDTLLIVIDNYDKMIDINNEEHFNEDTIIQVIINKGTENELYFVDMSDDEYNRGQITGVKDNKLYISIEDNYEKE